MVQMSFGVDEGEDGRLRWFHQSEQLETGTKLQITYGAWLATWREVRWDCMGQFGIDLGEQPEDCGKG